MRGQHVTPENPGADLARRLQVLPLVAQLQLQELERFGRDGSRDAGESSEGAGKMGQKVVICIDLYRTCTQGGPKSDPPPGTQNPGPQL